VTRFVLRTLALLPLAFAVWYFAAPILLWPAVLIVRAVAHTSFADLARVVEQSGGVATFVTTLGAGVAAAEGFVTVDVNLRAYAFGMPLFAALTLAAHTTRWKRWLAIGYAALTPVVAFGALADFLKNVAITAPPLVASQTGFGPRERDIIAFAYQFGSLILPAVVPAVAWVLTHRAFLERMRVPRGATTRP
jgi:hypothetical protein